jgi:hypothetical protein
MFHMKHEQAKYFNTEMADEIDMDWSTRGWSEMIPLE